MHPEHLDPEATSPPPVTEAVILEAISEVVDPEIGINVVDMGLIYGVELKGSRVEIKMTLTTPGCPMSASLARSVRIAVLRLNGVEEVEVEMVWDPPWSPSMMSAEVRQRLGIREGQKGLCGC